MALMPQNPNTVIRTAIIASAIRTAGLCNAAGVDWNPPGTGNTAVITVETAPVIATCVKASIHAFDRRENVAVNVTWNVHRTAQISVSMSPRFHPLERLPPGT